MKPALHEDMTMDEIMREWPATIRVVLAHGMMCVGCPIASFHTIEEAVKEHSIDGDRFRFEMETAIRA